MCISSVTTTLLVLPWEFSFTNQFHSNVEIPRIVPEFITGSDNVLVSGFIQQKSVLELRHLEEVLYLQTKNCAVSVGSQKLMNHQLTIGGPYPRDESYPQGLDFPIQELWGRKWSVVKAVAQAWAERERPLWFTSCTSSFLFSNLSTYIVQTWSSAASEISGTSHTSLTIVKGRTSRVHVMRGEVGSPCPDHYLQFRWGRVGPEAS